MLLKVQLQLQHLGVIIVFNIALVILLLPILVVENKRATEGFIAFIKRRIPMHIASSLDVKRLQVFDDYFKSDSFKL